MPLSAKVVSLRVRPFGVSHLCFETDGVLGDLNLGLNPNAAGLLGATVPAFDFDLFYGLLGSRPTQPATGSITFTTNPTDNTFIGLNGAIWTFVSSLTTGNQLLIAATLEATLSGALPKLRAATDANTKKFLFSASPTALNLTAATSGTAGNALAIIAFAPGAGPSPTLSGPTLSGADPSRLLYDFPNIQSEVRPFTLATLRAEPRKAALNKAINTRQNTYFAKYANASDIVAQMKQFYFTSLANPNPFSKSARLSTLFDISEAQWQALSTEYTSAGRADGPTAVAKTTTSTIKSDLTSYGYAAASGNEDQAGIGADKLPSGKISQRPELPPTPWQPPAQWPPPPPTGATAPPVTFPTDQPKGDWDKNWDPGFTVTSGGPNLSGSFQKTYSYTINSSNDATHQDQSITTNENVFRHPFYEAKAKYERAQISLIDQQFAAYMSAQTLQADANGRTRLETVFANELSSIDSDVYRLQIAYLNTILMSPIPGVVTGVYKNPGDAVKAGEPVLRIENYTIILIEGSLIFRGPVSIGQPVNVATALFGASSSQPTSISGVVVAARGKSDDDQWDVIVECKNMDAGNKPIFPLGYRFDHDNTTVTIG